jgi:4-amino-4-deoxy-L-arabinose transferase-like glycosyltransferase
MQRIARLVLAGLLGLLFLVAVWFRVTSLEALPDPDGDELWFATQFLHIARGEAFETTTPTGNPLTPFQGIVEVPLLLLWKPAYWIARLPAVLAGLLAVLLTYVLGSRVLGRTTALIAAGLMAVLPFAILHSRTGYDSSQAPFYGIMLLYFAFRANLLGVVVLMVVDYLVHPTNLFVTPAVIAVFTARVMSKPGFDLATQWKSLLLKVSAVGCVALGLGLYTMMRPLTQNLMNVYQLGAHKRHDLHQFWTWYGRLFLGTGHDEAQYYQAVGDVPLMKLMPYVPGHEPTRLDDWSFWSVFLAVLALGVVQLVRQRRWDRLALVVGAFLSALSIFVVGGSDILQPHMTRWGLFLLVPTVLAFACLVRSLLVTPTDPRRATVRLLQNAALLSAGWALLLSLSFEKISAVRILEAHPRGTTLPTRGTKTWPLVASGRSDPSGDRGEAVWTFRTEAKDAKERAVSAILKDYRGEIAGMKAARPPGAGRLPKCTIIVEDWWLYNPILFLTTPRRGVEVVRYDSMQPNYLLKYEHLRAMMASGAYAVAYAGQDVESIIRLSFPGSRLRRWDISRHGAPYISVYHLRPGTAPGEQTAYRPATPQWLAQYAGGATGATVREVPVAADYDGDGKADLAVFNPATSRWRIRYSGGGREEVTFGDSAGDVPVPGDYDGDGKADLAVYRPDVARWQVKLAAGSRLVETFGAPHVDVPVPGDYDRVGRVEMAVFRPTTGEWIIRRPDGRQRTVPFGSLNFLDIPMPADYDGDGRTEIAVFRPSEATWIIKSARDDLPVTTFNFGLRSLCDVPVPADYDGDGKADLAVYRPAVAQWIVQYSGGGAFNKWIGADNLDIPVPADYDGDGKVDLAVYRPDDGRWQTQGSRHGLTSVATLIDAEERGRAPLPAGRAGDAAPLSHAGRDRNSQTR